MPPPCKLWDKNSTVPGTSKEIHKYKLSSLCPYNLSDNYIGWSGLQIYTFSCCHKLCWRQLFWHSTQGGLFLKFKWGKFRSKLKGHNLVNAQLLCPITIQSQPPPRAGCPSRHFSVTNCATWASPGSWVLIPSVQFAGCKTCPSNQVCYPWPQGADGGLAGWGEEKVMRLGPGAAQSKEWAIHFTNLEDKEGKHPSEWLILQPWRRFLSLFISKGNPTVE